MKKIILAMLLFTLTSLCVFADHDERFFNALSNCTPYVSNGTVDTQGISADYKSQIVGWMNDKCLYKETVQFSGVDSCVTCKFTQNQINELVKVMKAYQTVQTYSGEEPDLSDIENVKNNPVIKVWNKYLQDSSTCSLDISGEFAELMRE